MVWINADGLRGLASELAALREEMAPASLPAPLTSAASPSAALQAAIISFDRMLLQSCTDSAQQVDELAADAQLASTRWAEADLTWGAALRAVPR